MGDRGAPPVYIRPTSPASAAQRSALHQPGSQRTTGLGEGEGGGSPFTTARCLRKGAVPAVEQRPLFLRGQVQPGKSCTTCGNGGPAKEHLAWRRGHVSELTVVSSILRVRHCEEIALLQISFRYKIQHNTGATKTNTDLDRQD